MRRPLSAALVAGLLLSSTASAQTITERLRVQGGYITQQNPSPQERFEDFFLMGTPELIASWPGRTSSLTLTYGVTGTGHLPAGTGELANRLNLAASFDLSRRTTLLISGEALQTQFSTFLLQNPAGNTSIALFPTPGARMLSARLIQSLNYEISSRWRYEQSADGGVITVLDPAPPLDTFLGGVGSTIEHLWRDDGVGLEARGSYNRSIAEPPIPDQETIIVTVGPRWRHDWSRTVTSSAGAGVTGVFSPRIEADPIYAPYGRASILYTLEPATFDLSYNTGIFASVLTGQVTRSHQVTLRGTTPLSEHAGVFLGASIGYLRGDIIDLTPARNDIGFDTVLADADLTWNATRFMSMFVRYQFTAQFSDVNQLTGLNTSFLRDMVLGGVTFSSRPTGGENVPTRFPQRVDRGDQAPRQ